MSDPCSIALLGPGAIGTTVAAALYEAGRTPTICGRTAHDHLRLRVDSSHITIPGPVHTDPNALFAPFDLVFVAVKSTQITDIAPWLGKLCHDKTVVCVLQNGVEQRTLFAPYLSASQILPSVVWFPAQRETGNQVWLRGNPRLTLPDVAESGIVLDVLRGTRCSVDLAADFTTVAWRKLMQNALAGLMVLTGRRAGMFSRIDITGVSLALLQECLAVARAEGASLGDDIPQEILAWFHRAPADLSTSILTDREAGLPLEWDCRNGVIQRFGRKHHLPTPVSDLIVPLLATASDGPG